jgi:hypothetical protein
MLAVLEWLDLTNRTGAHCAPEPIGVEATSRAWAVDDLVDWEWSHDA